MVENTEGGYQVSNLGNVRTLKITGSWKIGEPKPLKQYTDIGGYKLVTFWCNGKRKDQKVHRLVAAAFVDNPLSKPFVNHKDNNRINNRWDNLEWCTMAENIAHSARQGRMSSKLGIPEVDNIRKHLNMKCLNMAEIAYCHGISATTVANIRDGRTWIHYQTNQ